MENRLAEPVDHGLPQPGPVSPERFRTCYAIPIGRHGQYRTAESAARIDAVSHPAPAQDRPGDHRRSAEKIEIKQYSPTHHEQASLYQAVVADMMERSKQRRDRAVRQRAGPRWLLKQVCNYPAQAASIAPGRSAVREGDPPEEILEEIWPGDRVLCFTQFTEFAELLAPHLSAMLAVPPEHCLLARWHPRGSGVTRGPVPVRDGPAHFSCRR